MRFLLAALFLLTATAAFGQMDTLATDYGTYKGVSTLGSLGSFIFGLAVVFVLLFVFLWVLKRFTVQGRRISQLRDTTKILEITPLNAKNSIVIVKSLEAVYILGMTPDRIDLIDKVTDPEILTKIEESNRKLESVRFRDVLQKFGRKK